MCLFHGISPCLNIALLANNILFNFFFFLVVFIFFPNYFPDMTKYIIVSVLIIRKLYWSLTGLVLMNSALLLREVGILRGRSLAISQLLRRFLREDNCMHSENGSFFRAAGKKLFTFNCTCNYVADNWILFWKVSCEIHFFPKHWLWEDPISKLNIFRIV